MGSNVGLTSSINEEQIGENELTQNYKKEVQEELCRYGDNVSDTILGAGESLEIENKQFYENIDNGLNEYKGKTYLKYKEKIYEVLNIFGSVYVVNSLLDKTISIFNITGKKIKLLESDIISISETAIDGWFNYTQKYFSNTCPIEKKEIKTEEKGYLFISEKGKVLKFDGGDHFGDLKQFGAIFYYIFLKGNNSKYVKVTNIDKSYHIKQENVSEVVFQDGRKFLMIENPQILNDDYYNRPYTLLDADNLAILLENSLGLGYSKKGSYFIVKELKERKNWLTRKFLKPIKKESKETFKNIN